MPKKRVSYKGQICDILDERDASRSNDPAVKKAYLTKEFGWVIDQDTDSALEGISNGQTDTPDAG